MLDANTREAQRPDVATQNWQLKASRCFFVVAALALLGAVVMMRFDFGRHLGFETLYFFAVALAGLGFVARSNARDNVEDAKSIGVDIDAFHTTRAFNIGALAICAVFVLLYILLW